MTQKLDRATLSTLLDDLIATAKSILQQNPNIPYTEYEKLAKARAQTFQQIVTEDRVTPLLAELAAATQGMDLSVETKPEVKIIGAGTAGLLMGAVLAHHGAAVEIFEKRVKIDAMLRPQNISFKEAEARLRPLLGDELYNRFFEVGGALDGNTGKLRLTIGAFQEVLAEYAESVGVTIHYEREMHLADIKQLSADIVLLGLGVHTYKLLGLEKELQTEVFPEFTAKGRTALCIRETDEVQGYQRAEREGFHWRRDNKTVYSGDQLGADVKRVIRNLTRQGDKEGVIPRLATFNDSTNIEYTFIFGNATDDFMQGINQESSYLVHETAYDVEPMIVLNPIVHITNTPLVAIGDANGSPHPLAAIGTLKFIRNIEYLKEFIFRQAALKHVGADANTMTLAENIYTAQAMQNILHVFYSNVLCGVYSQERNFEK